MITGIPIGALIMLCVALMVIVLILRAQNRKKDEMIGGMSIRFNAIEDLIKNMPKNVINLSLKPLDVGTKLLPLELPIKPENFLVNVDKLKKLLLMKLEKIKSEDPSTKAICTLDHAGLGAIIGNTSLIELSKPLTRLLINEDMEAAKKYLETLAESICVEIMNPHTESE